ncbi:PhzF family phenazine biosynthesis protein [Jeongeupia naejangsanensis]|uniref:PhzF family phenazine biosynthesis protein n=1 Tax=Jeongeupia naejangsanensis TaxID=613195 RepID=A0ABS2BPR4_9NEIS|nr:PhzF family phenazine biosynthesis isomerase [Jeongeupia naejangsanensis]MBM3117611.1 PhzF family phenazine biosynthesis protein [Jeongeupia naejangsanensis]
MQYEFFLINGFAERRASGAPVAVFLVDTLPDDAVMRQLAYQLNQSESVFVTRDAGAIRCVTPQFTLPFSGLAQLAAAAVLHRETGRCPESLPGRYGPIQLSYDEHAYWFRAWANRTQPAAAGTMEIASALSVDARDIAAPALMIDTGLAQLMVPLRSRQAVLQAAPHPALLAQLAANGQHIAQLALWHRDGDIAMLRFFSSDSFNVYEDFGAGSAVANLGGWLLATGGEQPCRLKVEQGHTIHRPNTRLSVLHLQIGADRAIGVGGRVWIVGEGRVEL